VKWTAAEFPVTLRARVLRRGPPVHLVAVAMVEVAMVVAIDMRLKFVATLNAVAATEAQAVGTSILVRADRALARLAGAAGAGVAVAVMAAAASHYSLGIKKRLVIRVRVRLWSD